MSESAVWALGICAMLILFWGEPDIHDALLWELTSECPVLAEVE